jgi:hypothetical protein
MHQSSHNLSHHKLLSIFQSSTKFKVDTKAVEEVLLNGTAIFVLYTTPKDPKTKFHFLP